MQYNQDIANFYETVMTNGLLYVFRMRLVLHINVPYGTKWKVHGDHSAYKN